MLMGLSKYWNKFGLEIQNQDNCYTSLILSIVLIKYLVLTSILEYVS